MEANTKDTKHQIIDAAFDIIAERPLVQVSLSQVAERVGISKTAIFRHFLNKDALLEAMKADYFYKVGQVINQLTEGNSSAFFSAQFFDGMVIFFLENKKYLSFLIQLIIYTANVEEFFERELQTAGISIPKAAKLRRGTDGCTLQDKMQYYRLTYGGVTVLGFMSMYVVARDEQRQPVCTPAEFCAGIHAFLQCGMQGFARTEKTRLDELYSSLDFPALETSVRSKIFTALCHVAEQKGIAGVTVDAVAKEAGMAKSSLYNYFSGKDEMIRSLVTEELQFLVHLIARNYENARSNTELLAVFMYSLNYYFKRKPYSVRLFGWLRMNDFKTFVNALPAEIPRRNIFEGIAQPQLGMPLTSEMLTDWVASLPITLVLQGRQYNFTEEDIHNGINAMLGFITDGGDYE